jgi:hypothetical protein
VEVEIKNELVFCPTPQQVPVSRRRAWGHRPSFSDKELPSGTGFDRTSGSGVFPNLAAFLPMKSAIGFARVQPNLLTPVVLVAISGVCPVDVVGLLIFLALSYSAGYLTRDYISRKRHEQARRWTDYMEPEWLQPANTNDAAPCRATPGELGELGRMLDRWDSRARARRLRVSP